MYAINIEAQFSYNICVCYFVYKDIKRPSPPGRILKSPYNNASAIYCYYSYFGNCYYIAKCIYTLHGYYNVQH